MINKGNKNLFFEQLYERITSVQIIFPSFQKLCVRQTILD